MSLNKFSDKEKGYDLDLGVGADEMKANQMETVNIDLSTINGQPYPQGVFTNVNNLYSGNYQVTEGATLQGSNTTISQLQLGTYLRISGLQVMTTPSNGADNFDFSFNKSPELKAASTLTLVYRNAFAVDQGVGVQKYNIAAQSQEIIDPDRIVLTMKKTDATTFTSSTNLTLFWCMDFVIS
jgi:hypothetical protein